MMSISITCQKPGGKARNGRAPREQNADQTESGGAGNNLRSGAIWRGRLQREMAGNELASCRVQLQRRFLLGADITGSGAPGPEPAAGWRLRHSWQNCG